MRGIIVIALLGASLRIRQYLHGRSLWLDEVSLAHNLRSLGFPDILTTTLLDNQSAPPGFLALTQASVRVFGTSEQALRLIPLLGGLATVALSVIIAQRLLTHRLARMALVSLISLSPALIYYSNEVKQYSTDALATTAVIALWTLRHHRHATWILGLCGSLVALTSLPGLIMLAGLAAALLIERLQSGHTPGLGRRNITDLAAIAIGWLPGVGLHLAHALTIGADRSFMVTWWAERNAFAPAPTEILSEWTWYPLWLIRIMWVGIGEAGRLGSVVEFGPLSVLTGALTLALTFAALRGRPDLRWILAAPVVIALALSQLRIYPTSGRLSLYLAPLVILMIAAGADAVLTARPRSRTIGLGTGIGIGLLLAPLVIIQGAHSLPLALQPLNDRDITGLIDQVAEHSQTGDALIFERWSRPMKEWYLPRNTLQNPDTLAKVEIMILDGEIAASNGIPEALQLGTHPRIWVASTHRISTAALLAHTITQRAPFTLVCEWTPEPETYLGLLVRTDLLTDIDPATTCAGASTTRP